jgi:hypothetical protein
VPSFDSSDETTEQDEDHEADGVVGVNLWKCDGCKRESFELGVWHQSIGLLCADCTTNEGEFVADKDIIDAPSFHVLLDQ